MLAVSSLGLDFLKKLVAAWEASEDRSSLVGEGLADLELEEAPDASYVKLQKPAGPVKVERGLVPKACKTCGAVFDTDSELSEHEGKHEVEERKRVYFEKKKQEELERRKSLEFQKKKKQEEALSAVEAQRWRKRMEEESEKKLREKEAIESFMIRKKKMEEEEAERKENERLAGEARISRMRLEEEFRRRKAEEELERRRKAEEEEQRRRDVEEEDNRRRKVEEDKAKAEAAKSRIMALMSSTKESNDEIDRKRKASIDKDALMEKIKKLRQSSSTIETEPFEKSIPIIFSCTKCPFEGRKNIELKIHIRNEHSQEETSVVFSCLLCSFKAKKNIELKMHMRARHVEDNSDSFTAKPQFSNASAINHLLALQHEPVDKNPKDIETSVVFSCPRCSFKARKNIELKMHIRAKHAESNSANSPANPPRDPASKGLLALQYEPVSQSLEEGESYPVSLFTPTSPPDHQVSQFTPGMTVAQVLSASSLFFSSSSSILSSFSPSSSLIYFSPYFYAYFLPSSFNSSSFFSSSFYFYSSS